MESCLVGSGVQYMCLKHLIGDIQRQSHAVTAWPSSEAQLTAASLTACLFPVLERTIQLFFFFFK